MRTSELAGAALDWAVAKCEGMHVDISRGKWVVFDSDAFAEFRNDYNDDKLQSFRPSTNWAQGGPIIEREKIAVVYRAGGYWLAYTHENYQGRQAEGTDPTPLIAAMRCYVASKLGDEVDIPQELLTLDKTGEPK